MKLGELPSSYPFVSDEFELGSRIFDRIFASNHPMRMCLKCMGQNFNVETDEKTLRTTSDLLLEFGLIKSMHRFNGLKENDNYSITEEGKRAQKENLPHYCKNAKLLEDNLITTTENARTSIRYVRRAYWISKASVLVSVIAVILSVVLAKC